MTAARNYGDEPSFADMIRADRFAAVKSAATEQRTTTATRELFALTWPECFANKGKAKWPIKIGIDRDIKNAMPELSLAQIRAALADYCGGPTYHRAILSRSGRIDLHGKYAGIVRESDVQYAQSRIDKINAKHAKQKGGEA